MDFHLPAPAERDHITERNAWSGCYGVLTEKDSSEEQYLLFLMMIYGLL